MLRNYKKLLTLHNKSFSNWQPNLPKHKIIINKDTYRQPHPSWDLHDAEKIEQTHHKPVTIKDKLAYYAMKACRILFDTLTGYKKGAMNEHLYLKRAIFLETIAGCPGMIAGMHRHMRALRGLNEDGGWIHHLLEEAENERMHLITFLHLRQPGILMRLSIISGQFVFIFFYAMLYVISSKTAHRFVGYLEEEAVKTYTGVLEDYDAGKLPKWQSQAVPEYARTYWDLPEHCTMRDLIIAIRADEISHREYNHHFADINPYDPIENHADIDFRSRSLKEQNKKE